MKSTNYIFLFLTFLSVKLDDSSTGAPPLPPPPQPPTTILITNTSFIPPTTLENQNFTNSIINTSIANILNNGRKSFNFIYFIPFIVIILILFIITFGFNFCSNFFSKKSKNDSEDIEIKYDNRRRMSTGVHIDEVE